MGSTSFTIRGLLIRLHEERLARMHMKCFSRTVLGGSTVLAFTCSGPGQCALHPEPPQRKTPGAGHRRQR